MARLDRCIKVRIAIPTWGEPAMFNMNLLLLHLLSLKEFWLVNSSKLDKLNEIHVAIQTREQSAMFHLTITITIFRTSLNI